MAYACVGYKKRWMRCLNTNGACTCQRWIFHFVWIALWLKAKGRKNEKTWQDSFLIAYVIQSGRPLHEIPIMQEICRQSVLNSVETMQDRRTHLNQE